MKLTPIDIQQQKFRRSMRGYERDEVDAFLELVAEQVSELARENSELRAEQRRTQRQLEEHQGRESTLKEAMLTAQRSIDEIRQQAQKEAELTLTEADLRAEKLLFDAHKRVSGVIDDIHDLKRQRTRLGEELRGVLRTHDALLESIDGVEATADSPSGDRRQNQREGSVRVLERIRPPQPPRLEAHPSIEERLA